MELPMGPDNIRTMTGIRGAVLTPGLWLRALEFMTTLFGASRAAYGHDLAMILVTQLGPSPSGAISRFPAFGLPSVESPPMQADREGRNALAWTAPTSVAVSRYYFHVCNGNKYEDQEGCVFLTPEKARLHASVIAGELAEDGDWKGYAVVVTDKQGNELFRVLIVD
jgi:hypothetical protein